MVDATNETLRNEVVVTLDGRDIAIPFDTLGLSMDSTPNEILRACRGTISEGQGIDIADEDGQFSFGVRKAMNSGTIYVYPKPVAG